MLKAKYRTSFSSAEKFTGVLFSKIPITPNQWTLLSLIFGGAGFLLASIYGNLIASLVLFFLAFFFDYVDGAVARYSKLETKKGAYIDGISDRFVEAFIIFGLMFYKIPNVLVDANILLAVLLFFSTMTSYARSYAGHKGLITNEKELMRMGGLLERFERVFILLSSVSISFIYGAEIISYSIILLVLLSAITVAQRIFYVLRRPGR
ncbi:MAG: CDP-alcohol phosphatidyltransferase family protein [Candidatus Aenigmarchaeota archaeon]|nr:CDP-alcohol phosphatidyltransferase family protein [Candidatus Aenigmarchaeota archaeon]